MAVHLELIPVRWLVELWKMAEGGSPCPECRQTPDAIGFYRHVQGCPFEAILKGNELRNARTKRTPA